MNFTGIAIVSGFAAVWACAALLTAGLPPLAIAGPALVSIAILLLARRRPEAEVSPEERKRRNRIIGWATAVEVVAIIIAVNALRATGHADLMVAAVSAIVGLHFVPLAVSFKISAYWACAAVLVLAPVVLVLTTPAGAMRDIAICTMAAATLWLCALSALLAKPQLAPPDQG